MIQVTDKTLSCLDEYGATPEQLTEFCALLLQMGTDYIELSQDAYRKIGVLPKGGRYVLKAGEAAEIPDFPGFDRYVCRRSGFIVPSGVIEEIQVNDVNEIQLLRRCRTSEHVRITGLDSILSHDWAAAFEQIHKNLSGKVELCPENGSFCATAVAVEWILLGGRDVVASFDGVGGFAPTEEVFLALRLLARYKPAQDYSAFPRLRKLFEEITGRPVPRHKPVIGEDIFAVEAGIHADGISKDPQVYEPYRPELVGARRRFVMGKHSGKAAVILKMKELGLPVNPGEIPKVLEEVKKESIWKQESLTDEEFAGIVRAM